MAQRHALFGVNSNKNKLLIMLTNTMTPVNPNKALWEKGDFTQLAATMRESGEELVKKIGVIQGMRVLDLGCGDGTTAIPAARLGAIVRGVDIAANLVAAGNQRARAEGLSNCTFEEGDASGLQNVDDDSVDLVMTIFGAMFAPRPYDVAKEMVRVTRPGGRIVMGNWIPGDPTLVAQILKIASAYTPAPPAGFISPMLWGVEDQVIDRFEKAGIPKENISFARDMFTFQAAYPPSTFLDKFRFYYGPTMNAFDAAQREGKEDQLLAELNDLFKKQNQHPNENCTLIPATFLRVEVQC